MIPWTWILAAGGIAAAGAGYGIAEAKTLRVRHITISGAPASLHGKAAPLHFQTCISDGLSHWHNCTAV